ncbi:MAG TPA: type II 3-dehydroquinate dehydratase [Salinivirga sp.]|uniref:type II 3-dehydroquinate dehydratase n=1 Tax=Salinivirga sp. TaxID=1970192 RepID=UPI002B4AAD10|nr:type II 3-dehydroquinate dehydratase [Salinivirga sp.]HKK60010.1 type II 3-dehydroquinate dehydratase [Salinivirga sp.]
MKFAIVNGPNLNLLGKREPGVYGNQSFESYLNTLRKAYPGHKLIYFQSNVEGELINYLHEVGFDVDGIVFNPGGYSHTSVSIADAIAAIDAPVVEVHISNIYARENYRHQSLTGAKSKVVISGAGLQGYRLALQYLTELSV